MLQGTHMSEFNDLGGHSGGFKSARGLEEDCKESLLAVIEKQIIPRLLNVQQFFSVKSAHLPHLTSEGAHPEFDAFTQACMNGHTADANRLVNALMAQGMSAEQVFLDLVTPAARQLGAWWEQDLCDFTQVTCGLAIMHQMIYRLGYASPAGPSVEGETDRVMLACAPGSQHFLGLTIVADFFRTAGSEVVLEISSTQSELERAVANEWFDVVGISVALEAQLQSLPSLIQQLRARSGNPKVRVVLGGPIFVLKALHANELGADAIFTDARDAVPAVKQLIRGG
ncbi:MAG: cobalamin B12-binding domain-containing protein [Limnohabitans sp.]|nr:cobalamin B12-binding domain-containing protein [Limnohabitans sp.]